MSTWLDRLNDIMGIRGYESSMRRSLQTVVLYEAKRCVAPRLPSLRPFQRKLAFMDQAHALVESLSLPPLKKEELLWRTATSKETLKADIAWKRVKLIEKELDRLAREIQPHLAPGRTHAESVDLMVRELFQNANGSTDKPVPEHWEHAHNHVLMCFRLYYRGSSLDPTFPPAVPPRDIVVPAEKPASASAATGPVAPSTSQFYLKHHEPDEVDVGALLAGGEGEERRRILQEVRDHLDILKEFEGIISEEEMVKRKRELFVALPPAPAPHSKKCKTL